MEFRFLQLVSYTSLSNNYRFKYCHIQHHLVQQLEVRGVENQLSSREKAIITFIRNYPGCKSGDIANKTWDSHPTSKKDSSSFDSEKLIEKHGNGPGRIFE